MRSILFTAVYLSLNLCMRFVLINTEIVELTLFHFGAFVFFYQLNKQKKNIRFNNPMWTHQQSPHTTIQKYLFIKLTINHKFR